VPLLAVASHRDNDRRKFFGANMHDRGLATRLHELTAAFYDLEETRMFGGLAYMMNGHICFA